MADFYQRKINDLEADCCASLDEIRSHFTLTASNESNSELSSCSNLQLPEDEDDDYDDDDDDDNDDDDDVANVDDDNNRVEDDDDRADYDGNSDEEEAFYALTSADLNAKLDDLFLHSTIDRFTIDSTNVNFYSSLGEEEFVLWSIDNPWLDSSSFLNIENDRFAELTDIV
ncbi:hypothetical protein TKK_0017367 [Trichogramma kaykai]